MKKAILVTVISLGMAFSIFASLGMTPQAFTESQFAQINHFRLDQNHSKTDLLVYVGTGNQAVFLRMKKNIVYFEKFIKLSPAKTDDNPALKTSCLNFILMATGIQEGTPEYTELLDNVQNNVSEFTLRNTFDVKIYSQKTNKGSKTNVEVYRKK